MGVKKGIILLERATLKLTNCASEPFIVPHTLGRCLLNYTTKNGFRFVVHNENLKHYLCGIGIFEIHLDLFE